MTHGAVCGPSLPVRADNGPEFVPPAFGGLLLGVTNYSDRTLRNDCVKLLELVASQVHRRLQYGFSAWVQDVRAGLKVPAHLVG